MLSVHFCFTSRTCDKSLALLFSTGFPVRCRPDAHLFQKCWQLVQPKSVESALSFWVKNLKRDPTVKMKSCEEKQQEHSYFSTLIVVSGQNLNILWRRFCERSWKYLFLANSWFMSLWCFENSSRKSSKKKKKTFDNLVWMQFVNMAMKTVKSYFGKIKKKIPNKTNVSCFKVLRVNTKVDKNDQSHFGPYGLVFLSNHPR